MEIKQNDNSEKGMFYIETENKITAKMTYVWAGTDRIIIDHTEVGPELKGMGAGKQLLTKAIEFVRSKGIKIVPLCPFAKSVFDKVPEFRDVL
ncbi:MAG: N-acetyltransferase [Bacteroidia bacterium]|nr:N-acetyltransferase [Bacteroidia bacterium]